MRKGIPILLTICLLLMLVSPAMAEIEANSSPEPVLHGAKAILNEMNAWSKGKLQISWGGQGDSPVFISGTLSKEGIRNEQEVKKFLQRKESLFKIKDAQRELKLFDQQTDALGYTHYKFQQMYKGIPVYGSEYIVHTNKRKQINSVNGRFSTRIYKEAVETDPDISPEKAIDMAIRQIEKQIGGEIVLNEPYTKNPESKLVIYPFQKRHHLVYHVTLNFHKPKPGNWHVFVDAIDGKVIDKFNAIHHAAGTGIGVHGDVKKLQTLEENGLYHLIDTTKHMYNGSDEGSIVTADYETERIITDEDNHFTDGAAVDAHYYAGVVYDYFYDNFHRNSFDGLGSSIVSLVHVTEVDGEPMNNAYWNGSAMFYGDGDGVEFRPLSGELDVVAHELTHAVTENEANLEYRFQSGALNESFSDIFAAIIDGNWTIGEDVAIQLRAIRDMANPNLFGQPKKMSEYVVLPIIEDNGGVHVNSGIPNHAAYLIGTQLGIEKLGQIAYRALTTHLTSTAGFLDARNAFVQSAKELYGEESVEVNVVKAAWDAVEVPISHPSFDTFEDNDTPESAYSINFEETYHSYISGMYDVDFYKIALDKPKTIKLSLTNLPKDYDLELLNSSFDALEYSWEGGLDPEFVYSKLPAGTYYVMVHGYNGEFSQQPYTLELEDATPPQQVKSIVATPAVLSLKPGGTQQIRLNAYYQDNTKADVTAIAEWTSSHSWVASVSNGLVTGRDFGMATITARFGGTLVNIPVTIAVKSLQASQTSIAMKPNGTSRIELTAVMSDGTRMQVDGEHAEWISQNENIATVESGMIIAHDFGKTYITAVYGGKMTKIAVDVKLVRLEANPKKVTMKPDGEAFIELTAFYGDKSHENVTTRALWKSQNEQIASVIGGVVTAINFGTTSISATYGGKTVKIPVEIKLTKLVAAPNKITLKPDGTTAIKLTAVYGSVEEDVTNEAEWRSSNELVASVDENGNVTAHNFGKADITVTYRGKSVKIPVEIKLKKLTVEPGQFHMKPGDSKDIVLTADYGDVKNDVTNEASWQTSNADVAVFKDGNVVAKGFGKASLTASYRGKLVTVFVDTTLKKLAVDKTKITLRNGDLFTPTVRATYRDNETAEVKEDVEWTSSNSNIASVDENGQIMAKAKGKATITAKYGDKSIKISVTVAD